MKDYVREVIYNNAFTGKDVRLGRTGFTYWDNATQEERDAALQYVKEEWESMTTQEQAKFIDEFQAEIRKKQHADGGRLKNASSYDVIREMVNVDAVKAKEEAIAEAERLGRFDIAQDLRRRKLGVDTFHITLNYVDDEGKTVRTDTI